MDFTIGLIDPSIPRATQRAAVLAQGRENETVFEARITSLHTTHASRREELLQSISLLDDELARSMATIQHEILDADLMVQMQLSELDKLDEEDAKKSAFSKMPPEMLGYIFEQAVEGDQGQPGGEGLGVNPWILASVCKTWSRVAMSMGSLWRNILVTDTPSFYWMVERNSHMTTVPGLERTHSAIQVCTNQGQLGRALHRSGVAPLDITIGFRGDPQMMAKRLIYTKFYQILFRPLITPRIQRLVVDCSESCIRYSGDIFSQIQGLHTSLPNLVSLQVSSTVPLSMREQSGKRFLNAILENAPNLRDLGLPHSHGYEACILPEALRYDGWRISTYNSTILNLQKLRVHHVDHLDSMLLGAISIKGLVIRAAELIENSLTDQIWEIPSSPWPTSSTPEITFQRLSRLHLILDDLSLLSRLQLPVLEELRLTPSIEIRKTRGQADECLSSLALPAFSLDLPNLHTLRIMSLNVSIVSKFTMPRLQHLYLTSMRTSFPRTNADIASFVFLSGTSFFQGIRTLYLNAFMSETAMINLLKVCPSVQTLLLVPVRIGKVVISALTVGKKRPITVPVLCPDLRMLEVDCHSFRKWDKVERKELRVGAQIGRDLRELLLRMNKSRPQQSIERCTLIGVDGGREDLPL